MTFDQVALAAEAVETLKSIAARHRRISTGDMGLDIGGAGDLPDSAWDKAVEAARKELLKATEREFTTQAKALSDAGIEDIPTLTELTSS